MNTLIEFIARTDTILYALTGIAIFLSIRALVLARQARRVALFGLEREAIRQRETRAVSTIIAMLLLISGVYIISNIVAPNLGEGSEEPTPTPIVFVTEQPTSTQPLLLYPTVTSTIGLPPAQVAGTITPTEAQDTNGCEIPGTIINSPTPGQTVSGQVVVHGQANIINFVQYKFEVKGPSTNRAWVVVGTFTTPVGDGFLGTWDSTSLIPGNYALRLVVLRADGSFPSPCEVPIVVASPAGIVPAP